MQRATWHTYLKENQFCFFSAILLLSISVDVSAASSPFHLFNSVLEQSMFFLLAQILNPLWDGMWVGWRNISKQNQVPKLAWQTEELSEKVWYYSVRAGVKGCIFNVSYTGLSKKKNFRMETPTSHFIFKKLDEDCLCSLKPAGYCLCYI